MRCLRWPLAICYLVCSACFIFLLDHHRPLRHCKEIVQEHSCHLLQVVTFYSVVVSTISQARKQAILMLSVGHLYLITSPACTALMHSFLVRLCCFWWCQSSIDEFQITGCYNKWPGTYYQRYLWKISWPHPCLIIWWRFALIPFIQRLQPNLALCHHVHVLLLYPCSVITMLT